MRRRDLLAVLAAFCFGVLVMPALADNRVALVIGNGAYTHAPRLPNPSHDAEDVAAALKRLGFQTIVGFDLDHAGMQEVAIQFARAARNADVAVFYYSGHALQYAGVNYLVPVDAQLSDEADLRRTERVDEILADLQQAKNLRILVLDSCRDNPLAENLKRSIGVTRSASIGQGLAKMESPDGTIISYSTQAGRKADDGNGRNSPYTTAFLRHIEDKDDVATVFHHISANVYATTQGKQVPELSLSFFGEFYLNGRLQLEITTNPSPAPVDPCATASDHWKSAEAIGSVAAYEDHLARFPNCAFASLAKARLESLNSKVAVAAPSATSTAPNTDTSQAPQEHCRQFAGDWQTTADLTPMHIAQTGCSLSGSFTSASGIYRHTFVGTANSDSAALTINRIDGHQCRTKLNTVISYDPEGKLVWHILGTSGLCGLPAGYQETRIWHRIPSSPPRTSRRPT